VSARFAGARELLGLSVTKAMRAAFRRPPGLLSPKLLAIIRRGLAGTAKLRIYRKKARPHSRAGRKSVWANEAAKRRASSRRQREGCRRLFAVMHSPQISNHKRIDVGLALFPFLPRRYSPMRRQPGIIYPRRHSSYRYVLDDPRKAKSTA
jgi:hypothetical protein